MARELSLAELDRYMITTGCDWPDIKDMCCPSKVAAQLKQSSARPGTLSALAEHLQTLPPDRTPPTEDGPPTDVDQYPDIQPFTVNPDNIRLAAEFYAAWMNYRRS